MKIYIDYHTSNSDCECCGSYSAVRAEIYTEDRTLNVVLGDYASCFTMGDVEDREPYDVINEYLKSIGYNNIPVLPIEPDYTEIEKILISVEYQTNLLSFEEQLREVSYQESLQEYTKFFMNRNIIEYYGKHGIQLIIESTDDSDNGYFEDDYD